MQPSSGVSSPLSSPEQSARHRHRSGSSETQFTMSPEESAQSAWNPYRSGSSELTVSPRWSASSHERHESHEISDCLTPLEHSEEEPESHDVSENKEISAGWTIKLPPVYDSDDSRQSCNSSDTEHVAQESLDRQDQQRSSEAIDGDRRSASEDETDEDPPRESKTGRKSNSGVSDTENAPCRTPSSSSSAAATEGKSMRWCGGAGTGGSCLEEEGDVDEDSYSHHSQTVQPARPVPLPILYEAQRVANHASLIASRWAPCRSNHSPSSSKSLTTSTGIQTANADSELSRLLSELGAPPEDSEIESLSVERTSSSPCQYCQEAAAKAQVLSAEFVDLKAELVAERHGRKNANLLCEAISASADHHQESARRSESEAEVASKSAVDTRRALEEAASRSAEEAKEAQARLIKELHAETAAHKREMIEVNKLRKAARQQREESQRDQAEERQQKGLLLSELALEKRRRVENAAQRREVDSQQQSLVEDLRLKLSQAEKSRDDALERFRNSQREARTNKAAFVKCSSELSQEVEMRAAAEKEQENLKEQYGLLTSKYGACLEEWILLEKSCTVREERYLALVTELAAERPETKWSPLSMTCCQDNVGNSASSHASPAATQSQSPQRSPARQTSSPERKAVDRGAGQKNPVQRRKTSKSPSPHGSIAAKEVDSIDDDARQESFTSVEGRNSALSATSSTIDDEAWQERFASMAAAQAAEEAAATASGEPDLTASPPLDAVGAQLTDAIERMKLRRESEREELRSCQARASALQSLLES